MSLQIDIYFDPGDIQTLVSGSAEGVLVTCKLTDLPDPQLVAFAVLVNNQGTVLNAVLGCPTPCKPGDSATNGCLSASAEALQQLKMQITNPLNFLNSL